MRDALVSGRRFCIFNVVDDFNSEVLAPEIDLHIPALRVLRILVMIVVNCDQPLKMPMDNGASALADAGTLG